MADDIEMVIRKALYERQEHGVPVEQCTQCEDDARAIRDALTAAGYEIRPTTATSLQFMAENSVAVKIANSVVETIDSMLSAEQHAELERLFPGYSARRRAIKEGE